MPRSDSYALFASVKAVREQLEKKLTGADTEATRNELQSGLEEIEVLWEELRTHAEELARERQRYAEFFEYAPDAYLMTDAHGSIREANRAAAELLGAAPAALVRRPLVLYVPEEERRDFRRNLVRASAQMHGEAYEWHGKIKAADASERAAEFRVRATPLPGAGLAGLCWLVRRLD